jgi:hypothetical protein
MKPISEFCPKLRDKGLASAHSKRHYPKIAKNLPGCSRPSESTAEYVMLAVEKCRGREWAVA